MDFLIHKFSNWLTASKIQHELVQVKGGYIVQFIDPDEEFKKLISSLFITVDTGEDDGKIAKRIPMKIFTSNGDGIVIEYKYAGDIINTIHPVIRDYLANKKY